MTLYHAGNLPEGFVTLDELRDMAYSTAGNDGVLMEFEYEERKAVREFALDIAETLDAEANGSWDVRDTEGGRIAIFVPPTNPPTVRVRGAAIALGDPCR